MYGVAGTARRGDDPERDRLYGQRNEECDHDPRAPFHGGAHEARCGQERQPDAEHRGRRLRHRAARSQNRHPARSTGRVDDRHNGDGKGSEQQRSELLGAMELGPQGE